MKSIPCTEVSQWLEEIHALAVPKRYQGQKEQIINRIERAITEVGRREKSGYRVKNLIPSFFSRRA